MMRRLLQYSLHHPRIVAAIAGLLLIYGGFALPQVRLDVFPDFVPPQVLVQTDARGLPATAVERLVTRPLESAIAATPQLLAMRSQSVPGLSKIRVVFKRGSNPYRARQLLADVWPTYAPGCPLAPIARACRP
jgi:Putative silver efflux pump